MQDQKTEVNNESVGTTTQDKKQRCDQCKLWEWETTNLNGIGEGRCPHRSSTDGCDGGDCDYFDRDPVRG